MNKKETMPWTNTDNKQNLVITEDLDFETYRAKYEFCQNIIEEQERSHSVHSSDYEY